MSLAEARLTANAAPPSWFGPRSLAACLAVGLTASIAAVFGASVEVWSWPALVALPLVALTALWISGGAATALVGLTTPRRPRPPVPSGWRPDSRTAILVTLCKEDPGPLGQYLDVLRRGLDGAGLRAATKIFVLSDTSGAARIAEEEAVFLPLGRAGILRYRRRPRNVARKPGNIADWLDHHGACFDHMLVLDADSRMTPNRIRRMILHMDHRPDLGLLQAGIAILPGRTRFAKHQRRAARLLSRGFGRGFAAWSGDSGNYWGHNAILRVAAFRAARTLPVLSGPPPWGGTVLSHDFIEAAMIRKAGWAVILDPETDGSAEQAPETLRAFHARDRRWCQGNLQHLRLICAPGFDPVSRLHLALGILSYGIAPIWLSLIALLAFGGVLATGLGPLALVVAVLLVPKVCAVLDRWRTARTARRRAVILWASLAELAVSTVVAPLVMLRQAGAVGSVVLGRDCGWKAGSRNWPLLPAGLGEAAVGWLALALGVQAAGAEGAWLAPVAVPLCLAPVIVHVMERPA